MDSGKAVSRQNAQDAGNVWSGTERQGCMKAIVPSKQATASQAPWRVAHRQVPCGSSIGLRSSPGSARMLPPRTS